MKDLSKLFIGLTFSAAIVACGGTAQKENDAETDNVTKEEVNVEQANYEIVPDESTITWAGVLMGVYTHEGTIQLEKGELELEGDRVTGGSFVVDMSTITPTDENYNPEEGNSKEKLVEHLEGDDFFLVEEHPTAQFDITASHDDAVEGTLTIRGVSNDAKVESISVNHEERTVKGTLVFDRKAFNVAFTHPVQDMVVSNDVKINVSLKY